MNKEEIKKILPHREPMLLVEEAYVDEEGAAHGKYTIKGDEYFLQGHFPGNPVVPGVILCEMMAQACCVLMSELPDTKGKTPYFAGLEKVRFSKPVLPGDTLETTCTIRHLRGKFYGGEGEGRVDGQVAVSGKFSFALVDTNQDSD